MPPRLGVAALFGAVLGAGTPPSVAVALAATPQSTDSLEVDMGGRWHTVWRARAQPSRWYGTDSLVDRAVRWGSENAGIAVGTLEVRTGGRGRHVRVHVARLDPRQVGIALHANVREDELLPWGVSDAPADARIAFNAGQFTDDGPWGWVVHKGREVQPAATGPLSMALLVDTTGAVSLIGPDDIPAARDRAVEALQSYPALLTGDGMVPPEVLGNRPGLDLTHRDTRLAIGVTAQGHLLVVLTRQLVLGREVGPTPLGLTTPETAALLGALGARQAVMLDGGLSSQLLVRTAGRDVLRRRALRQVPFGVVGRQVAGRSSTTQPSRKLMMREP